MSETEKRLIAVSEEEVEMIESLLGRKPGTVGVGMYEEELVTLTALADRWDTGLDGAEAHEVSGMFITHWKPGEIDRGHPLYTGYLKLRQVSDEEHPRYSEQCSGYHALARFLESSLP